MLTWPPMQRLAALLSHWCTRFIPDAYVIAAVLSVVVFAVALLLGRSPLELVTHWGDGFWSFIPFTFQMAMVVLSGYIVAEAPPVRRALAWLATRPESPRGAVALVAFTSMALAWINWGLSIVSSALLARQVAKRRLRVDYRLLVASAYLGLGCMWHAGLSASAPLTSSDPSQNFVKQYLREPIPVTNTLFSPFNLLLAALVLVVMTLLAAALQPRQAEETFIDDEEDRELPPIVRTPAEWLENRPYVNVLFAAAVFIYLPLTVRSHGLRIITINHVNLFFLGLGALLHGTPASLLGAAERGGRYVWGVMLQFGLYAGVAGMLDKGGMATGIASGFSRVASAATFPLVVVWYSGILNYLVPSGGAKWAIEVQYLADASRDLGVPLSRTIVAYAWGDMLTDIIQPFWAIPLLALARLGFRDIMGYCLVFFLVYAALVSCAFGAWGLMI